MGTYTPPIPAQNYQDKIGPVVSAQWLNIVDGVVQGTAIPCTGTYQSPFTSGQVQLTGPSGFMTSYGDLTFGLTMPNPSGVPCPALLIGGAGKSTAAIVTDAQVAGLDGIRLIIAAGEVEDGMKGGQLLLLGGASNTGLGGDTTVQGGTSLNGNAGNCFVQGGNSTAGIAGNLYLSGGLQGAGGGGSVHLIMTDTALNSFNPGSIVIRVNSTILYTITSSGAIFIGSTGAGQPGYVMISGGPNSLPSWAPTAGAGLLYPVTTAENNAGVTPLNFNYPPGNVLRYGAVGDGIADDSTPIQKALLVGQQLNGPVIVLPADSAFLITTYLQIGSNTQLELQGTLFVNNRSAGLFSNGAANIVIEGYGTGMITDLSVQNNYQWNSSANGNSFPVIHLRSSSNCVIRNLNIQYVARGIFTSNATATTGPFIAGQAAPVSNKILNCNIQFCEYSGVSMLAGTDCSINGNYVYRCGDGGLWMMGTTDSEIVNNHRVSPQTVAADVVTFGTNNPDHPTTWNDEQGIQSEGCQDLLISGNVVKYFWAEGIDVKANTNRVLISNNRVVNVENLSIVVREGDPGDTFACHKVSIIGNTISGHGTVSFNTPVGLGGAILASSSYICEIINNVIYAYQGTPGIQCIGPGSYLTANFGGNPHQAMVKVSGNSFDFKNTSSENEIEIGYTAATPSAIVVNGSYDTVMITDNKITADYYYSSDSRINSTPAVVLTYSAANGTFYPSNAKIDSNSIGGWGGAGIQVIGLNALASSGLSICCNSIGVIGTGPFINVAQVNGCNISGNTCSQMNGGVIPGIVVSGSVGNLLSNAVVQGNSISGAWQTGGNGMSFGLWFNFCTSINAANNRVLNAISGPVVLSNNSGDVILAGTSGWPRSGSGSPNGAVVSSFAGEIYISTINNSIWISALGQSTVWTQIN
jgi:hypothetical protein